MDVFGAEAQTVWAALTVEREKSIVINFGSPFLSQFYFERAPVAINCYSFVPACLQAAVDILMGRPHCAWHEPGRPRSLLPGDQRRRVRTAARSRILIHLMSSLTTEV